MQVTEFYNRPMVKRIAEIFDNPKPPLVVTERQFDMCQSELEEMSRMPWHRIDRENYWYYMLNLKYGPSQQGLFDYLFPAFLIRWWEDQLNRTSELYGESDFYSALERGECLYKRMDDDRRDKVMEWMADAYIEGIDEWSGKLSFEKGGCTNFTGPISRFNSLGQSTPITPLIWERLSNVSTEGRAQFWLVLTSGITYPLGECEFIPESHDWCYILSSEAEHTSGSHGYFPENLNFMRKNVTRAALTSCLKAGAQHLTDPLNLEWAGAIIAEIERDASNFDHRLNLYLTRLDEYDLGAGVDVEID